MTKMKINQFLSFYHICSLNQNLSFKFIISIVNARPVVYGLKCIFSINNMKIAKWSSLDLSFMQE